MNKSLFFTLLFTLLHAPEDAPAPADEQPAEKIKKAIGEIKKNSEKISTLITPEQIELARALANAAELQQNFDRLDQSGSVFPQLSTRPTLKSKIKHFFKSFFTPSRPETLVLQEQLTELKKILKRNQANEEIHRRAINEMEAKARKALQNPLDNQLKQMAEKQLKNQKEMLDAAQNFNENLQRLINGMQKALTIKKIPSNTLTQITTAVTTSLEQARDYESAVREKAEKASREYQQTAQELSFRVAHIQAQWQQQNSLPITPNRRAPRRIVLQPLNHNPRQRSLSTSLRQLAGSDNQAASMSQEANLPGMPTESSETSPRSNTNQSVIRPHQMPAAQGSESRAARNRPNQQNSSSNSRKRS